MLGSQTWFLSLACPTIVIGGFIASRKRLAYQWREELMDPGNPAYPTVTDAEMEYFRRVAPARVVEDAEAKGLRNVDADAMGVSLAKEENIGLRMTSDVLTPAEQNVYLNEVKQWAAVLGNAIDPRKVSAFEARVAHEKAMAGKRVDEREQSEGSSSSSSLLGCSSVWLWPRAVLSFWRGQLSAEASSVTALDSSFFRALRILSDHPEDIQLMRAPWGCGDRMLPSKMPSALRDLVRRAESAHAGLGRLRHVYIEYSPAGEFFSAPRTPKAYDGHDYVVVPLRRDGGDTVVTFAPALRSKYSLLTEVMRNSWTSRDVDAFVPAGAMLRVCGSARYDWGWGVRPGPAWFGSRLNRANRAICADEAKEKELGRRQSGWWQRLTSRRRSTEAVRRGPSVGSSPFAAKDGTPTNDAALVVLHFEGPRAQNKQRSLLFQPERLVFGKPPTVESYEKWVDDRPTREDVREEGVVLFMLKHYLEMLTVS